MCEHMNLQPTVEVVRWRDPDTDEDLGLMLSVGIFCCDCTAQFEVVGDVKAGIGWDGPRRSVDSTLLNVPFAAPGEKVTDGLPSVDFGDPWLGKDDAQIEAMIRRALEAPQAYTWPVLQAL